MAVVRPLSRMTSDVKTQRSTLIETLTAVFAGVRFLAAMHPLVHNQIVLLGEALSAVRARVGLDARVHPVVDPQLLYPGKTLSADIAEVLLLMHHGLIVLVVLFQVRLQCFGLGEVLATKRTLIHRNDPFDAHLMVAHLVSREVTGERELLVAHDALERFDPAVDVLVLPVQHAVVESLTALLARVDELAQVVRVNVNHDGCPPGGFVLAQRAWKLVVWVVLEHMARIFIRLEERFAAQLAQVLLLVLHHVRLHLFHLARFHVTSVAGVHVAVDVVAVVVVCVGNLLLVQLAMLFQLTGGVKLCVTFLAFPYLVERVSPPGGAGYHLNDFFHVSLKFYLIYFQLKPENKTTLISNICI